jgi:hypothetical protein
MVLGEDSGFHGPEARGICTCKEREQKRLSHASLASRFRDVNRVRDDAGVRRPWRDAPENRPADDLSALGGHESVVR